MQALSAAPRAQVLDDDTYIASEQSGNLYVVRKNSEAASDEERARLDVSDAVCTVECLTALSFSVWEPNETRASTATEWLHRQSVSGNLVPCLHVLLAVPALATSTCQFLGGGRCPGVIVNHPL